MNLKSILFKKEIESKENVKNDGDVSNQDRVINHSESSKSIKEGLKRKYSNNTNTNK